MVGVAFICCTFVAKIKCLCTISRPLNLGGESCPNRAKVRLHGTECLDWFQFQFNLKKKPARAFTAERTGGTG